MARPPRSQGTGTSSGVRGGSSRPQRKRKRKCKQRRRSEPSELGAVALQGAPSCKAFLASYKLASAWVSRKLGRGDIDALLAGSGSGVVRIPNFLPLHVADTILRLLQSIPNESWGMTAANEDRGQNNINHVFLSTKGGEQLHQVFRVLSLLHNGGSGLFTFSAAKYGRGHFIAAHDDRAYTEVLLDTGQVVTCSRTIAVLYYLTRDWRLDCGGHFVDLQAGELHVPEYNTLIAFRVPRFHEVLPVTCDRPRFTPGRLYELNLGDKHNDSKGEEVPLKAC